MSESYVEVREDGSVRLAGTLAYPTATPTDVLTVQADGSIAAATPGGSIPSGDGSPVGVVAATVGGLYLDTTNGALYIGAGTTTADWLIVGGKSDPAAADSGYTNGVHSNGTTPASVSMLSGTQKSAIVSDSAAQNNTGNGLYWNDLEAADGAQRLAVVTGATGNKILPIADANGTFGAPPGGIKFPTSDPHVAGAWWDNGVTLMRSAG